jgi:hypothetical protein
MNPDVFAEWLRRQGHHVIRSESSYWHSQGPRAYQAFPYHWLAEPGEDELLQFLKGHKAICLRYSTPLSAREGCISYHAIYEKPSYGFEDLGQWARKNVRRGLKNCEVQPISFELLAEQGWELQSDTLERQGRQVGLLQTDWIRRCRAAADLPGFEAWGALVAGRLAASVITFLMEDCCYMLYQQCHRDHLRAHVNNALSFVVTQTMVARPQVRSILYGLHSLDAPASVDEFKFRMGYSAKPVRQRVVFHPWAAPLMTKPTHWILQVSRRLQPGNVTLAKAEGMIRFYLEGRRPLEQQTRPGPLEDRVEENVQQP